MDETHAIAIVFADISGSTRLYERLGDAAAEGQIGACLAALSAIVRHADGRVIKTIGDELMCAFGAPLNALQAAVQMQHSLSDDSLDIRVGVHYGPVVRRGDDLFGDTVNVAARLVTAAGAAQIVASAACCNAAGSGVVWQTRHLPPLSLKGRGEAFSALEILWDEREDLTSVIAREDVAALIGTPKAGLQVRYLGREWRVDQRHPVLSLGRDPSNDLVVEHPRASRRHARIEFQGSRCVLIDQSTNGTFYAIGGRGAVHLHREQVILSESGTIGLDGDPGASPASAIAFTMLS